MKGLIVLGVALVAAAPVSATELTMRWFGSGQCWARTYDAAHLARHRGQQVESIWLGGRGGDARPGAGEVNLGFRVAGRSGAYTGMAVCSDRQVSLVCGIEGDGGNVRVSRAGDDLQLRVTDRLALEGESDFSPELGGPQDRVFNLRRAPASACRNG